MLLRVVLIQFALLKPPERIDEALARARPPQDARPAWETAAPLDALLRACNFAQSMGLKGVVL